MIALAKVSVLRLRHSRTPAYLRATWSARLCLAMLCALATGASAAPLPEPDAGYYGNVMVEGASGTATLSVRRDSDLLAQTEVVLPAGSYVVRIALESPNAAQANRNAGVARVGDEIVFFLDGVEKLRHTIATRGEIAHLVVGGTVAVCGNPVSGADPTASDALFVLRAAVGLDTCAPVCVCDVDMSGAATATDALAVLKAAVGLNVTLDCGSCSSGA